MRTVLYVCTGNTCRSPMAEAIARHVLSGNHPGETGWTTGEIFVASAGVAAFPGVPTSVETIRTLERRGIAHDGTSKPLSAEMIHKAEVVFCMTSGHAEAARMLVADDPSQEAKIRLLDPDGDVQDPIGMGQDAYDALADRLLKILPTSLRESLSESERTS